MSYVGSNTWHGSYNDEDLTVRLTSETTAEVVYKSTFTNSGYTFPYVMNITVRKEESVPSKTETYNIAQVLNGEWEGVNGSGVVTQLGVVFTASMKSLAMKFTNTQAYGKSCTTVYTGLHEWDARADEATYALKMTREGNEATVNFMHSGGNTWRAEYEYETVTIRLISETKADVEWKGTDTDNKGVTYDYVLYFTIQKKAGTSAPEAEPARDNYTDTYDIAQVLNGRWYGLSGSGTASAAGETLNAEMNILSANISNVQISGSSGTATVTGNHSWSVWHQDGSYATTFEFKSTSDTISMTHAGVNTWRCVFSTGEVITMKATSSTTLDITQEGRGYKDGIYYDYALNMSAEKIQTSTTTPAPAPTQEPEPEQDTSSGYALSGSWNGYRGSGKAEGPDGTFELKMPLVNAVFGSENTAFSAKWSLYRDDSFVQTLQLHRSNEKVSVQNTGSGKWSLTFPNGSKASITLTSSTTAEVTEEGSFNLNGDTYTYNATYSMTKQ